MKAQILLNQAKHALSVGATLGFAFLVAFFGIFIFMMLMSLIARAFGLIVV